MTTKRKIITISDIPLGTSGVATQARMLFTGLVNTGHWQIRSLGAAIKHQSYENIIVSPDFIVKPIDGFGDPTLLRMILATERPDALLLFTDPRFFDHIWHMENEIRRICPIAYWHLWDSPLAPEFNKYVYNSCDLINCINWHTYQFASKWAPEKTNYVPHAVPPELYFPMSTQDIAAAKLRLLGPERVDHFVVLYVSRNAHRKMTPDVMASFKDFLDYLEKTHGHRKATLVMHTDPIDQEGTNLPEYANLFGLTKDVVYSKERVEFNMMNVLYNIADVLVSRSSAEGFGLSVLEAKMTETPVVGLMTGGVGRQVRDHVTGEEYGVALEPDVVSYGGNLMCPYITNDYVSNARVTAGLVKMYDIGLEERKLIGQRSRMHALRDYDLTKVIADWDVSLGNMIDKWQAQRNASKWTHESL